MHGMLPASAEPPASRPLSGAGAFALALKLAWRDLRGGLAGFWVFIACLALGVMAIAAVGSTARGLSEGLGREGRRILGGDISVSLVQREASPAELQALARLGKVSAITTLRAMANAGDKGAALVEIKAADDAYPTIGALETDPQLPPAALLALRDGAYGTVVDPVLLERLGLKIGERIRIGSAPVELRAALVAEPDKVAAGVGFGPRLILSQEALKASALLQPGSLSRWTYRVVLPEGASDMEIERLVTELKTAQPEAGWDIRARNNAAPQMQRNIERFTQFITLVGLTALLIGGVGVANAVRRFVDQKRMDFATLKALGAPGSRVVMIHFVEVMVVAAIGIALGLAAGAALPGLLAAGLKTVLPLPFEPALAPLELASAALFGFLTAGVFAILPLGRAHDVPVSALFRDLVQANAGRPRLRYVIVFALLALALAGAAILLAYDRRIAALYVGATAVIFVGLRLFALLLMAGARRLARPRQITLRLALANMVRPGALTPALVLSLGLGVALLTALAGIDASLSRQLTGGLSQRAPSFFFLDITNDETERFDGFIKGQIPGAVVERVPMMRGRIVRLRGVAAETIKAPEQVSWVLEGDRGLTYADAVPEGSRLAKGAWWPAGYSGPPLVSFDQEIAEQLGLGVGDDIVVNVLGRNITATIANLRVVDWRRLGINFVMVFSPNSFAGAPHTHLATATLAGPDDARRDGQVLKALAQEFPAVTAVRVRDALDAINDILGKLALAIRAASGLAIVASLLVLAGAVAAGQRARLYDAVILKTLGATRARLLGAYALEYGLIGLISALVGLGFGLGAGWAVVSRVMHLPYTPDVGAAALVALGAIGVAVVFGLGGTWAVLSQKPARHLRSL